MKPYNQFICGNDGDALDVSAYTSPTTNWTNPSDWLYDAFTAGTGRNDSGVRVTGYTALTHPAVWQAVNIISRDFGQTPVRLMRNTFDPQDKHPASKLLRVAPNGLQTPRLWKETMMQWALIWGNGVSLIVREGSRPVELIPLRPDCLWHQMLAFQEQEILVYHYHSPYPANAGGRLYTFFQDEVVHFQGLTGDGVWGYPLWQIAKNTIGHGLTAQRHSNRMFANGVRTTGILKHPGRPSEEARKNIRREFNEIHSGPDNAGKVVLLAEAMDFVPVSMSSVESELIDTQKLSVYQIAGLFNLPPHKLGAMDAAKYNNIEEQNADYESRTLSAHYNAADEEYRRKLLTTSEWQSDEYCFKHDPNAFLKGDNDTQTMIGDRCVKATIMNPNEARALIGLPPYPGGEKYGSPAINPNENSPSSAGKTPKEPPRGPKPPQNIAKARPIGGKLKSRVVRALQTECDLLNEAARAEPNFIQWMDGFYGTEECSGDVIGIFKGLTAKTKAFKPLNRDISRVRANFKIWAMKRKADLLDVCATVTAAKLPGALQRFTDVVSINASCDRITSSGQGE